MALRQQLAPSRGPLPPQRWGFLPTEQFWNLAQLTPITFAFWIPAFIFHDCLVYFAGLPWWQNGLACMAFAALWAGLVERWSRQYLVRRRMRALTEGGLEDAEARVPSSVESQKLPVFATHEFWDYAFARLFGRARGVASTLLDFMFFMTFFYPSALVLVGTFSLLVVISLGLGAWQRRLLRRELEADAQAGAALVEASGSGGSRSRTTTA